MSNSRGAPNTITISCPEWGQVRYVLERQVTTSHFWNAIGETRRSLFSNGDTFEHTTTPLFGSSEIANTPLEMGALAAGEERWAKIYRQRSQTDVTVPLLANVVSSGLAGVIALTGSLLVRSMALVTNPLWLRNTQYWVGHRWYIVTPVATLTTMAYLWFKKQLPDLLNDETLIASAQGQERHPEPPPPAPTPSPSVEVIIPQQNGAQRGYSDKRATLSSPKSDPEGLWRYCAALANGTAFPSWEGGETAPGAKAFGYTENELKHWRNECVRIGLLEPPTAKNQPYIITGDAIGAFRAIARSKAKSESYAVRPSSVRPSVGHPDATETTIGQGG